MKIDIIYSFDRSTSRLIQEHQDKVNTAIGKLDYQGESGESITHGEHYDGNALIALTTYITYNECKFDETDY